jgi:hypothetical protein
MANEEHLAILKKGIPAWNGWIERQRQVEMFKTDLWWPTVADLSGADLSGARLACADFHSVDLSGAKLTGASLHGAELWRANLRAADLTKADLTEAKCLKANLHGTILREAKAGFAYLKEVNLRDADLSRADLGGANLALSDLTGATLAGADLGGAMLVKTILVRADLTGCRIYGASVWDADLSDAKQQNIIVTQDDQPAITVDNIEVAQFMYLLLHNDKLRHIIDTITSKVVLILGRFTSERKAVLDALREELRRRDWLPMLFDFEKPSSRDITETISLLATMSRFIVADITDARSIPQELARIVPHLPSVPVQPLLLTGSGEYGMFEHFRRYPWVLELYQYASPERLIADVGARVVGPAEAKARELQGRS